VTRAAVGTNTAGRVQTDQWLARGALALVLLPLVVSAVALVVDVGTSYVAGSDQGLIELRTSDVGRHAVLVGPYARDGWNHPGPALFYALALPYRLAGSNSIGLDFGALLINGLAITGMAFVVRRRGGLPLLLLTLVGCAVLMRSLGAEFLHDPWNPYITVLPFGLLVLLAWAMTCGDAWALPVGVGVASFCVQTHVGYVPIAIPLLVWGTTWLVLTCRRRGDADENDGYRGRDLVRAGLVAVAVLVVMWLPVVVQQLTDSPGNLSEVVEDFTEGKGLEHSFGEGYRIVSGQFGLVPQWLTGRVELDPFSGQPLLLYEAPMPLLLIPFGLAVVAFWRWRLSEASRLAATLMLTLALGVLAVSRVTGPVYAYRLRWTWFLAMLAMVMAVWAAWTLIAKRALTTGWMRWGLAVPVAALVVLGGVNFSSAVRAGHPQPNISSAVHTLGPSVEAALPEGQADVVVRSTSFEGDAYQTALVLYLESHGTAVRVDRSRKDEYGGHRVHESHEPQRALLTVAADQSFDEMSTRPDLRVVAYWGARARQVRAEIVTRRSDLTSAYENGTVGFEAFKRRLSSLHLGPAVGVFMTSSAQR
jgi:hypothetical protein